MAALRVRVLVVAKTRFRQLHAWSDSGSFAVPQLLDECVRIQIITNSQAAIR
eukprot:CAMPEP_0203963118 /NCGR_PEP_ID=MMETSP0359-20131031/93147_1 /ASSEMBLY_ACC=CAM_ASM_000338 /TAXON_ID=268821 /ORGANISM="Scrippsiella Hangoei, Strain SHTV-5" /LENGTH=51 /DNA_ID=CAMNT_0050898789 /DNA_START=46 /DNA_END=198 /DNA_ORIENTATION=-